MSAINTITVADAAATPVNHNFIPHKIVGDVAWYNEKSATSAQGFMPLSVSLRSPQAGTGARVFRQQVNFAMPVLMTDSEGNEVVSHTLRANVEFILPERSTLQERKDVLELTRNILENSQITDAVENLNNVY